jgi:hypothetical protein
MNIKGVPLTHLSGSTTDISALLRFYFWQPVYYKCSEASFPSDSKEAFGHIVGISEHCGHALTYKILTSDKEHINYRSLLRPATPTDANLRADMFGGEQDTHNVNPIIKTRHDFDITDESKLTDTAASASPPPVINPEDLIIGSSHLMDKQEDGQQYRGRIVQLIEYHDPMVEDNPNTIKFRVSVNNDQAEEISTYNKLLDYLAKDLETDIVWKFRLIISHNGPFQANHPEYKGSQYNLMIEWENEEITTI